MSSILLIRTEMSGALIGSPVLIERKNIPLLGSLYYSIPYQKAFVHVVNHSYSPDDKSSLYEVIVHAIYDLAKEQHGKL